MDRRDFILTANRIPSSQGKNSHWLKSCVTVFSVVLLLFHSHDYISMYIYLYIYKINSTILRMNESSNPYITPLPT